MKVISSQIFSYNFTVSDSWDMDSKSRQWIVVVVTLPFSRDGGMARNHAYPEAGQLPRAWTTGRRVTESRQKASGAKSS